MRNKYWGIRSGTYNGTVIAHGNSPLQWTATSSGTYYAHWNTNSSCGVENSCVTTSITFVSGGGGGDHCYTCPTYDFGIYTPSLTPATHSSSTTTGAGCRWYAFNVAQGAEYVFSTCSNGGTYTNDSKMWLYNNSCGLITSVDDYCGVGPQITWTATYSGVVYLEIAHYSFTSAVSWTLAYWRGVLPGENCSNAQDLGSLTSPYNGTTIGYADDISICRTGYPDRVFYISVPNGYSIDIWESVNSYDEWEYMGYGGSCPGTNTINCWDNDGLSHNTWINSTGSTQTVWYVQDAFSGSGTFTLNWTLTVAVSEETWTGAISTDWNTTGNWSAGVIPNSNIAVTIPTAPIGGRWPHVTGGYSSANLTLQSGSYLYVDAGAYYLWVYGNISNSGTISCSGTYPDDISIRGGGSRTISGGTFTGVGFGIYDGTTVTASTNISTLDALYPSAGCTFNASNYNITVSGHVNNDGIINAGSGTLTIGGNYTHYSSAGTFNANTSTVVFNGSSTSYIYDTPTFYKLTINNSAGVYLSGTSTINNYLTLTSGLFTNGTMLDNNSGNKLSDKMPIHSSLLSRDDFRNNLITTVDAQKPKFKNYSNRNDIPRDRGINSNEESKRTNSNEESKRTNSNEESKIRSNANSKDILKSTDDIKDSPDANNLTFGNGATIERINGSLSAIAPAFGTSVNIIYSGSSPINTGVEIPIATTVLNNLTINNTGGVTLSGNATVNGTLALTNGLLNTGTYSLNFGTSAANPTETSSNRIVGTSVMNYRTVGTGSLYFLNCNIASGTDVLGNVKITRKTGTIGAITYNGNTGIKSNWDILSTNQPTSGRNVTFEWLPIYDPIPPFTSGTLANIFYSTDNGTTWALTGTAIDPTTYGSLRGFTINTTHFSMWTVGRNDAPLPVTLSSFTSLSKGRDVVLNWKTDKETNNAGFDVERAEVRDQNSEYKKIGFIPGKGSSNSPVNYTFEDKKLNSGKYNYRLKQIDNNGNFEYHNFSTVVDVALPTKFNLSQNYPNPFNPTTKIDFDLPFDSKVNIIMYDITGREVKTLVNDARTAGFHTIQFNASDLSSGTYFYRIMTKSNGGDYVMTKKMALIK